MIGVEQCHQGSGGCNHVSGTCNGCFSKANLGCPQCISNHGLLQGTSDCAQVNSTVVGYYWQWNGSTWFTQRCAPGCKACLNNHPLNCTESRDGYSLKKHNPTYGQSFKQCGDTFVSINKVCQPCDPQCLRCSAPNSPTSCTACKQNTVMRILSPGICSAGLTCGPGEYVAPGSVCQTCHAECLTCSGTTNNDCLSCNPGWRYITLENKCSQAPCPVGTYPEPTVCNPCDFNCETCDGPLTTNCLTCLPGRLRQLDLSCKIGCNVGSYNPPNSLICQACSSLCDVCTTGNPADCTKCQNLSFMTPITGCVSSCAPGFYQVLTPIRRCFECHASCKTCSGPLDTQCQSCEFPSTFDIATNTCICNLEGWFNFNGNCILCDFSCKDCSGKLNTQCQSCKLGDTLNTRDKTCNKTCPSDMYISNQVCYDCDPSCLTCEESGPNKCLSCKDYYQYLSVDQACVVCDNLKILSQDPLCYFSKEIKAREEKSNPDPYSSNTIEVFFSKQNEFSSILKNIDSLKISTLLQVKLFYLQIF